MGLQNELCLLSFVLTLTGVLGGDYCSYSNDYLLASATRWCSYGCCGYDDTDCCDANVALIVGLTVLGVLIVSTIIAVVCCCIRRRGNAGSIIQTNPGSGLVVTSAQSTSMSQGGQPVSYMTQGQQPGVYSPPQPHAGQPHAGQPYAGQPYAGQPYAGQPYAGQPCAGQPYAPPQPYPTGQQPPPPMGAAMAPPPYSPDGGQVNPGYGYDKPAN